VSEAQKASSEAARHAIPPGLIHDLRTPLNQIQGYTELLIEQRGEQGADDFTTDLHKIRAASQRLLSLINDNFVPANAPVSDPAQAALSVKRPEAEKITEKSAVTEQPTGTGQGLVLVVDDIEENRDVLTRRLSRQGYTVAIAENGRQALERLHAATFDLVLLDIMMPEMDGYEVLQRIKADEVLRHIPVIMISALSELDSVVRCIEMGADDYLPKPFNPILLKARIGACLEKKRMHDREIQLFAQLQIHNVEMARWRKMQDADLAVARVTQQAIVSSPIPPIEGWQVETTYVPVIQVGGDVYGCRQLDRGVWLFWLADATGHGVAAALFTTLVAALFDRASSESNTARGILSRVNAEFYEVLRGRSFMSACCVVVNSDGRLSVAGAGHPPLLIRRRNGDIEKFPSANVLMGIESAGTMSEATTTLTSGDVALLYTDGLHSLKTKGGARMTSQSLADILAPCADGADLLPRLLAELVQRSDGQPFEDDLAAITLRRN
jgi:sigma-B regulation protein RsbU (phosphoserine phosphatase)